MLPNAFIQWPQAPTDEEVATALGSAKKLWDRLRAELAQELELPEQEWHCFSPKHGWAVRIKRKKRNILYVIPCAKSFRVAFVLGEKAIADARESGLSQHIYDLFDAAPKYPEGRGIYFGVKKVADLATVKTLTQIKLAH